MLSKKCLKNSNESLKSVLQNYIENGCERPKNREKLSCRNSVRRVKMRKQKIKGFFGSSHENMLNENRVKNDFIPRILLV